MLESSHLLAQSSPVADVAGAPLGDTRLQRRYDDIVRGFSARPGASVPEAMRTEARREGYYRFMRNDAVDHHSLLEPHFEETTARAEALERVLIAHDTTEFAFAVHDEPAREHLARPSSKRQSFLWHASLMLAADGTRAPLGLIASRPFVHASELPDDASRAFWAAQDGLFDNEMRRWMDAVEAAEARLVDVAHPIHVMDREGDDYGLLFRMSSSGYGFVVRMTYDRNVCDGPYQKDYTSLSKTLDGVAWQPGTRKVELSARPKSRASKGHPVRRARTARLKVRACEVELRRPDHVLASEAPARQPVHVVEVVETDPPHGEEPVRWVLFTSEPIGCADDIWEIVDIYRARWVIEEYFKAIKSGTRYKELQHRSAQTLLNALSAKAVVAWDLLRLRHLGRHLPEADADLVVNRIQLALLQRLRPKLVPEDATAADVMGGVAGLGGHIRQNGPPGWLVLGRGWEYLLELEQGFRLAQEIGAEM